MAFAIKGRWRLDAWNRNTRSWQTLGTFWSMSDAVDTWKRYRNARIVDNTNETRIR